MKEFFIFIGIAATIAIVFFLTKEVMMRKITNIIIGSNFDVRYNDNHTLKYFTVDDFENLKAEPLEFENNKGDKLRGYIYSSTNVEKYKALMIVAHGLGAGHLQYTTEINYFAQKGYLVFAYDVTGCNLSEGEKIGGLTQALIDLKTALEYIDNDSELSKMPKVLFGHSMGAYAVSNITSLYNKEIKGIVALAPFKNESSMLYEQFSSMTSLKYSKVEKLLIKNYHKRFNEIADINTLDSYENTNVPHLVIAGDKDNIVDCFTNFNVFKERFENKENFEFLEVKDRYHRPNLSLEAAAYDQETNEELQKMNAEYKGKTPEELKMDFYRGLDYDLLVQMDEIVMEKIEQFLTNCLK